MTFQSKLWSAVLVVAMLCFARPNAWATVEVNPTFSDLRRGESQAETYDLNSLGLVEVKTIFLNSFGPNTETPASWTPTVGKYRRQISREDFVKMMGRDDLLRSYGHRRTAGIIMLVVGAASVGTGLYLMSRPSHSTGLAWGLAGGGALVIGLGFAGVSSSSLMTAEQAVESCYRYNEGLRAHLGLPPFKAEPSTPHARTPSLARRLIAGLGLGAAPGGASAGLTLPF
ncbi:MAG: hypothetical protein ABJA82_04555 [Myxococcales bacterium]